MADAYTRTRGSPQLRPRRANMCTDMRVSPRAYVNALRARARVHLRHVYPSRFGLGGYIGESRPENWLGTMDRENFTKGREGGPVGVHAVDGMETGA